MPKQAKKQIPGARCCWVCGKPGGAGFTNALRQAGYELKHGEMGYAHPQCMRKALEKAYPGY